MPSRWVQNLPTMDASWRIAVRLCHLRLDYVNFHDPSCPYKPLSIKRLHAVA